MIRCREPLHRGD